tara:strand:+ start:437 stop:832 length:396 start_codon:yes stop_codon:yes gene_type:complete
VSVFKNNSSEGLSTAPNIWLSQRSYKGHSLIYSTSVLLWGLAVAFIPGDWSLFWPIMIWTIAYMIHFLIYKGTHIDEDWVRDRVKRLTDEAKDLSHIEAIRDDYTSSSRQRRLTLDSTKKPDQLTKNEASD